MDQVTQQNAALVEEAAAAAGSLEPQAQRLHDVVSVFRLQPLHAVAAVTAPKRTQSAARPDKAGTSASKRLAVVATQSTAPLKARVKAAAKSGVRPDLKPVPSVAGAKAAVSDDDWQTF